MSLKHKIAKLRGKAKGNWEKEYVTALEKLASEIDNRVVSAIFELCKNVVYRTPVGAPDGVNSAPYLSPTSNTGVPWASKPPTGYREGTLRGNWQLTMKVPSSAFMDQIDDVAGVKTLAAIKAVLVTGYKAGEEVFWLSNNAPYARVVEYLGHSPQAKAGMLRLSIAEAAGSFKKAGVQIKL